MNSSFPNRWSFSYLKFTKYVTNIIDEPKYKPVFPQDKPFYFPKFTVFSGEDPKPKKEASFEEWKYEVNCARKDKQYTESMIAQAIRKSLSGQAKRVILPLGTTATVEQMIEKLEGVFGNVATGSQ